MTIDEATVLCGVAFRGCAKDDYVAAGMISATVLAFVKGYLSSEELQHRLAEIIDHSHNRIHLEFMDRE